MSFEMRMKFPSVSGLSYAVVHDEFERLRRAGWSVDEVASISFLGRIISGKGRIFPSVSREIRQIHLVGVHWNQHFLSLEPVEISVVFRNSLQPSSCFSEQFLDTGTCWQRFESDIISGFWYEVRTNLAEKTLEIRVFSGQQLGKENLKRFILTLSSYHTATKVARCLHQLRTAANKQSFQEMDRYHNEILETLGAYLPR